MQEISQQDIINAIVALDGKKLKELQCTLREQCANLYNKREVKRRILTILNKTGVECPEGEQCAAEIKTLGEECSAISALLDQIHRAIEAFG